MEARLDEMQFDLAHRPLQAEQQPVIENAWMVQTLGVADERIDDRAQVQQVIPIAIISSQPTYLDSQHQAHSTEPYVCHQPIETRARQTRAAHSLIVVDDAHVVHLPSKFD